MISILIPVYNTKVESLVQSLASQLVQSGLEGEIIVADDCSADEFRESNNIITSIPNVKYLTLQENIGRQKIRKYLAERANHRWLLFLDGDSIIINDQFIDNYLNALGDLGSVITGGRIYQKEKPTECTYTLHWLYGSKREAGESRTAAFMSNNFCISRDLFLELSPVKELSGYGHEDTWMGMELEQRGAVLRKIRNPVLHAGIETSDTYLRKSREALLNLLQLERQVAKDALRKHVRIYRYYHFVSAMNVSGLVAFFYRRFEKALLGNLHSCHPSLVLFDFYRLTQLILLARSGK